MVDRPVDAEVRAGPDHRARGGRLLSYLVGLRSWIAATFERELEQRRGFLWLPVLVGLGVLVYFGLPSEPGLAPLLAATLALAAAALLFRRRIGWLHLFLALAIIAGGTTLMKLRTGMVDAPILGFSYSGTLTGWVEQIERFGPREVRIVVRVVSLEDLDPAHTPHRVRISVRGAFDGVAVGAGVSGPVALQPPAAPVIPGGYDFGRELFYQGIGASGFSYGPPDIVDLGRPPFSLAWHIPIERLRAHIGATIETALPGDTGQIANALVTGDRGGISDGMNTAYQVSGLAHVLSISGLHMALVAAFVFAILRGGLALIPILALRYPIKKWAAAGTLLVSGFYLLISGSDVAAERSFIMLAVMMVAILADRRALSIRNIATAALLILILTPEAILTAGFQMSFAATLALIAGFEWFAERRRQRLAIGPPPSRTLPRTALLWVAGLAATSLLAGLATAPFGAFHFNRTQPLALFANLAAGPFISLAVMFPAMLAMVLMPLGLQALPLAVMGWGLDRVNEIAELTTRLTGDSGFIAASPPVALYAAVLGILWLCIWRERWRLLGVLPLALALLLAGHAVQPDILVDEEGAAMMVRAPDGAYRFMGRGATYESQTWLRMDGDRRQPRDPSLSADIFCDPLGCTAPLRSGGRAALVTDARALAEDCRNAIVIVTQAPVPAGCGALVVTAAQLAVRGVHALYADPAEPGGYRIETVRRETNLRPWMPELQ